MIYKLLNGPYINNENRRIVFVKSVDSDYKCISYARYLMSNHLNRELKNNEEVDHIDNNKLNDCIENYQILTSAENRLKRTLFNPAKLYTFNCPMCNNYCVKYLRNVRHAKKQGKAGPFCSKSCAGKYGKMIQNAGMVELVYTADLKPAA